MDWLAVSSKSTKPKTSNYKLTEQGFRASFTYNRNFSNLNNVLCHHFFKNFDKPECIAAINALNVTVTLNKNKEIGLKL